VVVLILKKQNRTVYFGHTVFNQFSFIYAKDDLKYYQNLLKIVGKTKCFILGTKSRMERDRVVTECSKYIFSIQKNINKRMSLLKEDTSKVNTHTDMEIVLAEKQGEKLVYVLEATTAITSNDNNTSSRKNGKLQFRLFKRYSKVEDFHRKI
jgi:hypothetical protein